MARLTHPFAMETSNNFSSQSVSRPSLVETADTRVLPSGVKAKDLLACRVSGMLARFLPVVKSQSCTPSSPTIARVLPSGDNARDVPGASSFIFSFPVATSHNLTAPGSRWHVARVLPSAENAREYTPLR